MEKKRIAWILGALMLISTIIPLVFADAAITNVRFEAMGNYAIVASGVGLWDVDSGDIVITVPGTDVVAAFLYWSGIDLETGGDDEVLFDGNTITADDQFGPDFWLTLGDDFYHFVYVAEVTEYVNLGSDTYTVDEFEMSYEYGAGLMVVYEDAILPWARVTILDGLDSYFYGFPDPRGPNSEVFSLDFAGYEMERVAEVIMFAGGCSGPDDPNKVLTETGDGAKPTTLVGAPSVAPWSLTASDGQAWDTYIADVTVGANDEWICVQVESVGTTGASGLINGAGFVLPIPQRDGLSPGFWKHNIAVYLGENPGRYSVPHEDEPRIDGPTLEGYLAIIGVTAQEAYDALSARGRGSATIRLDMANAFNAAAGYTPYSDD